MNDYQNILEEYKNIQTMVEGHINELNLIQNKVKLFKNSMCVLKEDLLSIPEIQSDSFAFLNPLINNFNNNLQININQFNDLIINPLESFIFSFNFAISKNE